ncbi:hypothetical protein ColLi_05100 [Colletotrichum liriopes]|uniref:Uncharacterized protein n=1 Tax=Colletotrichum liriopes TaxID=708192 RepID=A0AA37GKS7_9PEZI|nr:hypothetical protein ColLi_05100 [Colletotrichum liriopes]
MSLRNFLPIVIAVVTGVGIFPQPKKKLCFMMSVSLTYLATYTLKPGLEEQKRLRESKEQLPRTFPPAEPKNPESQTPNQTIPKPGADTGSSWRNT